MQKVIGILVILNGILKVGKNTAIIVSGKKIQGMQLLNVQYCSRIFN